MKRYIVSKLAIISAFLALTWCTVPTHAQSPAVEATLAGHHFQLADPSTGFWRGKLTLTLNGTNYDGTGAWWITDIKVNKNSYHWFASGIYDFGELGPFEIWEEGKWDPTEPNSGLSGMNRIVGGTGIFEGAHGELQYIVYEHDHVNDEVEVNLLLRGHLILVPDTAE